MDQRTSPLVSHHPAHLWVGQHDELLDKTIAYLQQHLCAHKGCSVCITCTQIRDQQHHAILWLYPEKQYSIDDLEIIFKTISFALEDDAHFYIVIQKADYLTVQCANSLLKSLEEPPAGYHFILLAQRIDSILPTIQSRCIIEQFDQFTTHKHPLFDYFATTSLSDPLVFLQEIDKQTPTERESVELVDQLLTHWIALYKKAIIEKNSDQMHAITKIIKQLKKSLLQPPMPGSSKLFWKNIFIQLSAHNN